jgi:DNA-binding transcriptional MerR regulator
MAEEPTFSLSEVARRLDVPQHRLIHLCEKGVVVPDVHDAAGRGSSRLFSSRNVLELALALRLREMMLPVATASAVIHVLRAFESQLRQEIPGFSLAETLQETRSPDLRVIISDGQTLYFSLGLPGHTPKLFGGVPLDHVAGNGKAWTGRIDPVPAGAVRTGAFGGPEHSQFARLELGVTAVAHALPLS